MCIQSIGMKAASELLAKGSLEGVIKTSSAGAIGTTNTKPVPVNPASASDRPRKVHPTLARRLVGLVGAVNSGHESNAANRHDFATALLLDAIEARASDIHLEPVENAFRVRFRVDGALSDVVEMSTETGKHLTNQVKALASLDPIVRFTPKDSHFRFSENGRVIDLRIAVAPSQQGETLSIRLLDPRRLERSIDDLGLTESKLQQLESWLDAVNGMFLAAGPTGSGKTTTVYALLHELKFADRRIVSIEDPVEYAIPGITQVQLDEKHHLSFAEGVKAVLRLDPDLVMMGEIRDAASAHAAVDAAITGRVLLSTVHSRDAVGAITALRNWGLPDHEIAESVAVIVAQRLVRRLCEHCRTPVHPGLSEIAWLRAVGLSTPKQIWAGKGCERCGGLGFQGRTGIFELWHLSEADYRLILAHADEHTLRRQFHTAQRETLLQDGIAKVACGVTSLAEIKRAGSGAFPSASWQAGEFQAQPPFGEREREFLHPETA